MFSLTVGYVSGIVAACIFILQYLLSNAATLILVAALDKEHTAATWSVVGRELNSSAWPTLLGTDSTASPGFKPKLRLASWLRRVCLIIVTIAGIVTPLGLYDAVTLSKDTTLRSFSYVADQGPMGIGTPPRSPTPFGRTCGDFYPLACPGTSVDIIYNINKTTGDGTVTVVNDDYDMRIPEVLAKLYQSGLSDQQQTVSSFFDIQSRQYTYLTEPGVQKGKFYTVAAYRQLTSLILDDDIEAVEGLIVNTLTGGVGFRNHTVPDDVEFGAEWTEEILFIEPETQCVDTNVTLEYTIPSRLSADPVANLALVDQGGFANLNTTYPHLEFRNNQEDPMLQERAYKAAWLLNAYNMLYFNVTRPSPNAFSYLNSKIGQRFPLSSWGSSVSLTALTTSSLWDSLVNPQPYQPNVTLQTAQNYPNPFNITFGNYTDFSVLCEGVGGEDLANMNNIAVKCGLVLAAAKRKDGTKSIVLEPGTWWSQSVYTCASTTKASIKNVHFKLNATLGTGLKNLQVLDVSDKIYPNDSAKPLWGVENPNMELINITPLWGLVSPSLEHSVNLSTVRSDKLYLPGYTILEEDVAVPDFESMPGTSGPANCLGNAYDISGYDSVSGLLDYSGLSNLAIFSKWQEYSSSVSTTAKIIDLIWTDVVANALVGTKSWNSGQKLPPNLQRRAIDTSSPTSTSVQVPVNLYTHQIYYNWLFAIPAAVLLLLAVIVLGAAALLTLFGHVSFARVREYLFHLSAGRLLAMQAYPGEVDMQAPTKTWVAGMGRKHIRLHSEGPIATDMPSGKPSPAIPSGFPAESKLDTQSLLKADQHMGKSSSGAGISTQEVKDPATLSPSQPTFGAPRGYTELQDGYGSRDPSRSPDSR